MSSFDVQFVMLNAESQDSRQRQKMLYDKLSSLRSISAAVCFFLFILTIFSFS